MGMSAGCSVGQLRLRTVLKSVKTTSSSWSISYRERLVVISAKSTFWPTANMFIPHNDIHLLGRLTNTTRDYLRREWFGRWNSQFSFLYASGRVQWGHNRGSKQTNSVTSSKTKILILQIASKRVPEDLDTPRVAIQLARVCWLRLFRRMIHMSSVDSCLGVGYFLRNMEQLIV